MLEFETRFYKNAFAHFKAIRAEPPQFRDVIRFLRTSYRDWSDSVLIGYVSDEQHQALTDAAVVIENDKISITTRSSADGSIYADVPVGQYRIAQSDAPLPPAND